MARQEGSKNKDKGRVLRAIRNYAGEDFDPAVKLIELAMKAEEEDNIAQASQNYGKLMEYCYPKLRNTDVTADVQVTSYEQWLAELEGEDTETE